MFHAIVRYCIIAHYIMYLSKEIGTLPIQFPIKSRIQRAYINGFCPYNVNEIEKNRNVSLA